jgi:hypothetical protein
MASSFVESGDGDGGAPPADLPSDCQQLSLTQFHAQGPDRKTAMMILMFRL